MLLSPCAIFLDVHSASGPVQFEATSLSTTYEQYTVSLLILGGEKGCLHGGKKAENFKELM